MEQTYFRKGFGLKKELRPLIDAEYHSALVERVRARGYTDAFGDVTVRLAQEFGFCYGVDRAVDYAYETVHKFPDKRIWLVGEIIHNPHVNQRMTDMGIAFIYPDAKGHFDFSDIGSEDVVILPAFGVTTHDFATLQKIGCILVDTTCGSVLHVWKRVEGYARDGFTSVIHGKYSHEESRATASQATKYNGGKYLIVRDMDEAMLVCDYIARRPGHLSRDAFIAQFRKDYDIAPDMVGASSFDAVTILAEAIKRAKSTKADAVIKALHGIKNFDGVVTGPFYGFTRGGQVIKPSVVQIVKDGEFHHFAVIDDPAIRNLH